MCEELTTIQRNNLEWFMLKLLKRFGVFNCKIINIRKLTNTPDRRDFTITFIFNKKEQATWGLAFDKKEFDSLSPKYLDINMFDYAEQSTRLGDDRSFLFNLKNVSENLIESI